jgi:hypothetical protein
LLVVSKWDHFHVGWVEARNLTNFSHQFFTKNVKTFSLMPFTHTKPEKLLLQSQSLFGRKPPRPYA